MLAAIAGAAAAAGAAGLGYASLVERNWFALRRHRVPVLPPGSKPMTLLHFSDLHLRPQQSRKRSFIASCAALAPDLAVGTGDFLGDSGAADAAVEAITAIRPGVAGLFVLGSNDYYLPTPKSPTVYLKRRHEPSKYRHGGMNAQWKDLVAGLTAAGWRDMSNTTAEVGGIDVAGLDDPHIGRADYTVPQPRGGPGFRLALAHSPDAAPALAAAGYDLILCGHTHGGQVRVPGVGALVTNSTLPRRYARGLHRFEGAWLHVSGGLGTSKYAPVRFACRPEICLLELVPRTDG